ncbi:MAG TPA: DUF6300 family protein [Streptosporangiaceae bacterium]
MKQPRHGSRPVDVRLAGDLPCCPRCEQQGLLTADVPHGWDDADGTATHGTIPVVLCAACDHDSPTAGPLIVFLLVHEQITAETLHECAALIRHWADSITIPPVNAEALEAEITAWRQGEL